MKRQRRSTSPSEAARGSHSTPYHCPTKFLRNTAIDARDEERRRRVRSASTSVAKPREGARAFTPPRRMPPVPPSVAIAAAFSTTSVSAATPEPSSRKSFSLGGASGGAWSGGSSGRGSRGILSSGSGGGHHNNHNINHRHDGGDQASGSSRNLSEVAPELVRRELWHLLHVAAQCPPPDGPGGCVGSTRGGAARGGRMAPHDEGRSRRRSGVGRPRQRQRKVQQSGTNIRPTTAMTPVTSPASTNSASPSASDARTAFRRALPLVLVGYGRDGDGHDGDDSDWLEVPRRALSYWVSGQLRPYSSEKPISYDVITPPDILQATERAVGAYFRELSGVYAQCGMGTHSPRTAGSGSPRPGTRGGGSSSSFATMPAASSAASLSLVDSFRGRYLALLHGRHRGVRGSRSSCACDAARGNLDRTRLHGGQERSGQFATVVTYMVHPFTAEHDVMSLSRGVAEARAQFRSELSSPSCGDRHAPALDEFDREVLELVPISHVNTQRNIAEFLPLLQVQAAAIYTKIRRTLVQSCGVSLPHVQDLGLLADTDLARAEEEGDHGRSPAIIAAWSSNTGMNTSKASALDHRASMLPLSLSSSSSSSSPSSIVSTVAASASSLSSVASSLPSNEFASRRNYEPLWMLAAPAENVDAAITAGGRGGGGVSGEPPQVVSIVDDDISVIHGSLAWLDADGAGVASAWTDSRGELLHTHSVVPQLNRNDAYGFQPIGAHRGRVERSRGDTEAGLRNVLREGLRIASQRSGLRAWAADRPKSKEFQEGLSARARAAGAGNADTESKAESKTQPLHSSTSSLAAVDDVRMGTSRESGFNRMEGADAIRTMAASHSSSAVGAAAATAAADAVASATTASLVTAVGDAVGDADYDATPVACRMVLCKSGTLAWTHLEVELLNAMLSELSFAPQSGDPSTPPQELPNAVGMCPSSPEKQSVDTVTVQGGDGVTGDSVSRGGDLIIRGPNSLTLTLVSLAGEAKGAREQAPFVLSGRVSCGDVNGDENGSIEILAAAERSNIRRHLEVRLWTWLPEFRYRVVLYMYACTR